MQLIPAINTISFGEAERQIKQAAEFSNWIHIDVVDGVFAPNVTWGAPEELKLLVASGQPLVANFEIHLMVENPEQVLKSWLEAGLPNEALAKAGAKRIIVHLEAMQDPAYILETCKNYEAEAMLAINPETPTDNLMPYLHEFKYCQTLAVSPGLAGQQFQKPVLEKIKFLRQKFPDVKIEVDGGINLETAKLCKDAGADIIVSASYVFGSPDPKGAYEELVKATSD